MRICRNAAAPPAPPSNASTPTGRLSRAVCAHVRSCVGGGTARGSPSASGGNAIGSACAASSRVAASISSWMPAPTTAPPAVFNATLPAVTGNVMGVSASATRMVGALLMRDKPVMRARPDAARAGRPTTAPPSVRARNSGVLSRQLGSITPSVSFTVSLYPCAMFCAVSLPVTRPYNPIVASGIAVNAPAATCPLSAPRLVLHPRARCSARRSRGAGGGPARGSGGGPASGSVAISVASAILESAQATCLHVATAAATADLSSRSRVRVRCDR